MFDIGFWELLTIGLLGLLILGPERLPGAIRSVQQTIGKMRAFGSRMEAEIKHELRVKELHENLKKIESTEELDQLSPELKASLRQLEAAAASVRHPYAKTGHTDQSPAATAAEGTASSQHTSDKLAPEPDTPAQGATDKTAAKASQSATPNSTNSKGKQTPDPDQGESPGPGDQPPGKGGQDE